ncbi:low-specificity L-threonine aldolase [Desulfofustis glycolicus]|uniref:L-threonine aldolase n=1 Tax=Desulfofustis glycolicus DSM 9705 TaxID=1121409 RepID=A0A1M5Y0P2_9BACT|nr:low-specificity L-threonine aldolase [Desulfofustis glycolicus]MCB2217696.1 low-specificity L-threonine aldolase [Desulfobulbaceae bacterium]SHI05620.1 L-threonine aldolase [Desulfofustis glycolicus DSM 9705]
MRHIDLRSDTVTKPTPAMREAMAAAEVGDDVYGEDPTVNELEELTASMLACEAGLFAPSGTQTNLLALLSHCQRGDEYIVGQLAHTYKYEGGGAAVLGSIQPQPLDFEQDGTLDLERVAAAVKPDDFHFAKTKLLCLENTQGGLALPLDYLARARACADRYGLKLHLDGARIFNAAIKCAVEVSEISRHFDTVSVCLSKGLGAPIGSVLCGDRQTIARARRWRKMLGGGMRQAGIIAAAGIFALQHQYRRLQQDHEHARLLADGLSEITECSVDYHAAQTNMVFLTIPRQAVGELQSSMAEQGILLAGGQRIRLVTHLDIDKQDITRLVSSFRDFFSS